MDMPNARINLHALNPQQGAVEMPGSSEDPAVAFEALFVGEIFKAMRATVHETDVSFGKSVFTSMLDEKLAQNIAESGGLGLTSVLRDELGVQDLNLAAHANLNEP